MLVDDPVLLAALVPLPLPQRAVYVLHEVLHWDTGDIAELLGWTVDCVDHALEESRRRLA